jgi:hypothetical protein
MIEQDLQNLKNDPQFIQNLEELSKEAKEQNSVEKAYQVLDASLLLEEENEIIDSLYVEILQIAFDDLAQKLAQGEKFDETKSEDLARMRAIYEHGIEKYSSNDFTGAKEIFLILLYMFTNESVKEAMGMHIVCAVNEVDFEDFFENYCDAKAISEDVSDFAHFITHFSPEGKEYLKQNGKVLEDALEELESLKG